MSYKHRKIEMLRNSISDVNSNDNLENDKTLGQKGRPK